LWFERKAFELCGFEGDLAADQEYYFWGCTGCIAVTKNHVEEKR